MMRKIRGIVLKRMALGEQDKIVTVFTREAGKLRAVAKGARSARSRISGATEPFTIVDALLSEGNRLPVFGQAEVREAFPKLRTDYALVLRATYLCELLDRVTEDQDPHAELFDVVVRGLYHLPEALQPDFVVHSTEIRILEAAGYAPRLDACVTCGLRFEGRAVPMAFAPARGGVLCGDCSETSGGHFVPCDRNTIQCFDRLALAEDTRTLLSGELPTAAMAKVHRLVREHLRHRLDRELKSSSFLDALRLDEAGEDLP